jgi:hypothetical protein
MFSKLIHGGLGVKNLGKYLLTSSLISNLLYHYLPLPLKKAIFMGIVVDVIHERHMIKRRHIQKLPLRILTDIHSEKIATKHLNDLPDDLTTRKKQIELAEFFYNAIPRCFRYASYRSVKHDILNGLEKCPNGFNVHYA